jgi:hypothetical protein
VGGDGTLAPVTRYGGGVYCYASSPIIRNNIIDWNTAYQDGGSGYGGGICCRANGCAPTVSSNLIGLNQSNWGGGIYCVNSSPKILNNVIESNTAHTYLGDAGYGGGIRCVTSPALIINNTIDNNDGKEHGAGISFDESRAYLINNIISNSRSSEGIFIECYSDTAYISYCDFWANNWGDFGGVVILGLGDTTWGENRNGTPCDTFYNILENPNYVDGYHLDSSSACIDAGDNNAPALPPTDFDGNERVVDGNGDDSAFVDMGAYEYQPEGSGGLGKIVGGDREDTETNASSGIADKFFLSQNYPNPFNPTTVVEFNITQPAKVSLKIYNILGQLVRILVDEEKPAGTYTVYWDGKDKNGRPVSSGIYFYKLDAGDFTEVKKMVLIK